MAVLRGGLAGWIESGYPVVALSVDAQEAVTSSDASGKGGESPEIEASAPRGRALLETFLPRLAGAGAFAPQDLPIKREMAVLFVDMTRSTSLLQQHSVEKVLALIQVFMEEVTEAAVAYCGDVKDFEGDGALLYFEDVAEAVRAAFALRDALVRKRRDLPDLPQPRLSVNVGPMIIGSIGSRFRQSIALVGPSINVAARILKHAPPGGIIVPLSLAHALEKTDPDLAGRFTLCERALTLAGFEEEEVSVCLATPPAPEPSSQAG